MPPEIKRKITEINEITCENCLFGANRYKWGDPDCDKYYACHCVWNDVFLDGIKNKDDFCSAGLWSIGNTVSGMPLVYQYLMSRNNNND